MPHEERREGRVLARGDWRAGGGRGEPQRAPDAVERVSGCDRGPEHEAGPLVSPERARGFERVVAGALLLPAVEQVSA